MPVQRQQKITSLFQQNVSESSTSEAKKPKKKPSPTSVKTDIVISIRQQHMDNIVSRVKNHEFRKYNISSNIERMWFYTSAPDQTLRYIAVISNGKKTGEVEDEEGLGNSDFNQGLKESKFAYEILHLYKIHTPLTSPELKEKYKLLPPQRYQYLPGALADAVVWDEQEMLF